MCIQGADREELGQPPLPLGFTEQSKNQGVGGSASTSSLSIVLGFSIVNTVNLFTGDQGTLIAGCTTQNSPPPSGNKTPQVELHFSMPTNLQSAPPVVPR